MGFSDKDFRGIMAREYMREFNAGLAFPNWQSCKYSGCCSFEKFRLLFAVVKEQEHCSNNPGVGECGAYKYLEGLGDG